MNAVLHTDRSVLNRSSPAPPIIMTTVKPRSSWSYTTQITIPCRRCRCLLSMLTLLCALISWQTLFSSIYRCSIKTSSPIIALVITATDLFAWFSVSEHRLIKWWWTSACEIMVFTGTYQKIDRMWKEQQVYLLPKVSDQAWCTMSHLRLQRQEPIWPDLVFNTQLFNFRIKASSRGQT